MLEWQYVYLILYIFSQIQKVRNLKIVRPNMAQLYSPEVGKFEKSWFCITAK